MITMPPNIDNASLFQWLQELYNYLTIRQGVIVNITDTGAADTEFAVLHEMGAKPKFVERLITEDDSGDANIVYLGTTAWDKNNVYLKCNAANKNVTVRVY